MRAKRGFGKGKWVTTEDTRYNDFMAKPKGYLVRLIMGLGDMARYEDEKAIKKEMEERETWSHLFTPRY